jgi:hypothetical protein
MLDSALLRISFSANEDGLTLTKYVQVNEHEQGRSL